MNLIFLTRGMVTVIDDEDFESLSQFKWYAMESHGQFYAVRTVKRHPVLMHRVIMNAPPGSKVDHRDGYGLNNRRANLRIVSDAENLWNRGKTRANTSGFKGVFFDKKTSRFYAMIRANKVTTYLGYFSTALEAAMAYDRAAVEIHGVYAKTNIVPCVAVQ